MMAVGYEEPRRILLTGAAGGIGRAFFRAARERYRFRLADRVPINAQTQVNPTHEVVQFDITDLSACQRACVQIDTVVHLAADANPRAEFYDSLLDNNIKGVYNVFRAAKDQGCRRVVFASSAWVAGGYPRDVQVSPEAPPRPVNLYGVSKCFGEAIAAYFAQAEGLSSIVVRIGAYDDGGADNWLRQRPNVRDLATYISAHDLQHLLIRCIEAPEISFAIAHGLSDNRFKRLDLTATRELLGYVPQDDAFEIFGEALSEWLRD
jgi:nucleoside-diphosphate-sugar epimerase